MVADEYGNIRETIKKIQPTAVIEKIEPSPLSGLFSVYAKDYEPIYMTLDGKRFLVGTLLEVTENGKVIDRGAEHKNSERAALLAKVPVNDMIVFKPKGKTLQTVHVFTDVDCSYCQKLHQDINAYTAAGIEIRYLAYPRGGLETETFSKMESIWCAKDRHQLMTKAKAGSSVDVEICSNPVASQYRLGKAMGVQGTPSIYDQDGRQIGGYLTVDGMKKALGI